jgi:hypothetical protein
VRAHVVFESMFGNGHAIADAVADGLRAAEPRLDVTVVNVLVVADAPDTDLLVVGGPTHAFTLSRPQTRASRPDHLADPEARRRAESEPGADTGRGVREWLDDLSGLDGTPVAAFDTRVGTPVPKRAAAGIARRLRRAGGTLVVPPEGFLVTGMHGPLVEGDLTRAAAWGAAVLRAASTG